MSTKDQRYSMSGAHNIGSSTTGKSNDRSVTTTGSNSSLVRTKEVKSTTSNKSGASRQSSNYASQQ